MDITVERTERFRTTQLDHVLTDERYVGFYIGTKVFFEPVSLFQKYKHYQKLYDALMPANQDSDSIITLERDADAFTLLLNYLKSGE